MTIRDSARTEDLLDDMDRALVELVQPLERDPGAWARGPEGKWTAGQHVAHVAKALGRTADGLEAATARLRAGTLGKRPWRDPVQAFFIRLVTREPFPHGGKAPGVIQPQARPDRGDTLRRLAEEGARHRAAAHASTPEEQSRIWIRNPFIGLWWHYRFPEIFLLHTSHTRHHARLVREAVQFPPRG